MYIIKANASRPREIVPGARAVFTHSGKMTMAEWVFDPEVELPEHNHPHEQISRIISGVFDLTIEGKVNRMEAGDVAIIPPDAVHSGESVTRCHIIDVFHPVREDYR